MKILTSEYLEAILYRLGARNFDVTPIYDLVVRCYNDGKHVYHTLDNHIEPGLRLIHEHILKTEHPNTIMCAWVFHDLIIDPIRHDNEQRSAELCREVLLSIGIPASKVEEVVQLILATKHSDPVGDLDKRFICDIDLSFLALDFSDFVNNTNKLRQEYGDRPEADFVRGEMAFFERLLNRDKIFQTEIFQNLFEKRTRRNIRGSLRLLRRKSR